MTIGHSILMRASCYGCCNSIFVRFQSYRLALDLHKRPAIRATILAHQDTHLHLPTWLVSMADRVGAVLSALSIWWSQHRCLEQLVLDSNSTPGRTGHVCPTVRPGDTQQTSQTEGSHAGEEGQIDMTKLLMFIRKFNRSRQQRTCSLWRSCRLCA